MWTMLRRPVLFLLIVLAVSAGLPSSAMAQECPTSRTYGDPSHPNSFTFLHEDGAERVLHFERVAVSIDPDGVHTFHVPRFGNSNVRGGMTLQLSASPAGAGAYSLNMFAGGVSPSDCMPILPDVGRWSWLGDRSMDVQHFEAPGAGPGRFTAEIRMLETGDEPAGMIARIDTEHVTVLTASSADARGMRVSTTADGATDTVTYNAGTALFRETEGALAVRLTSSDGRLREMSLAGVRAAPQVVAVDGGSIVWLYDVQELTADGLTFDEYRRDVVVIERTTEPLLERPRTPPVADLEGAERTGRYEIPAVVNLPELGFLEVGDAPPVTVSPTGEPLAFDDLPTAAAPRDLARPAPGRAYFAYYPDHDLYRPEYTEIMAPGDASPFTLRIVSGIVRPEGTAAAAAAAEPEPELSTELVEMTEIMAEIFDAVTDPDNEGSEAALVGGIMEKRGVTLDRAITIADLESLFEGEVPFFLEGYDDDIVAEAFALQMGSVRETLQSVYDAIAAEVSAYEATLDLDEAGAPLRRRFTESNTSFDMEYRGDVIFITAMNEAQGTDTLTVRLPAGAHDLLQWNDVLSRLPLADGFERTLTFFDLDVYSGRSMGLGDDGQGYSRRYVRGAPVYVTATVRVTGQEMVESEGELVSAHRVEVHFDGEVGHPAMSVLSPDLNAKGREGEPLIYLTSVAAPHRVLRADWRETAVQRALH